MQRTGRPCPLCSVTSPRSHQPGFTQGTATSASKHPGSPPGHQETCGSSTGPRGGWVGRLSELRDRCRARAFARQAHARVRPNGHLPKYKGRTLPAASRAPFKRQHRAPGAQIARYSQDSCGQGEEGARQGSPGCGVATRTRSLRKKVCAVCCAGADGDAPLTVCTRQKERP